jgi:hypothetical protein
MSCRLIAGILLKNMDDTRLTILADPTFAPLLPTLHGRLELVGQSITAQNFASILDDTMKHVLQKAIEGVGGTEGSVWLLDQASDSVTIAYNTGPNSGTLTGQFKQPLSSGLISMVFSMEQPFVENEVYKNSGQNKTLDSKLGVRTYAMIAVPFYFLDTCRGVISCVQLTHPDVEDKGLRGFDDNHGHVLRYASGTLGRLIDHWAIRKTIGLE